MEIERTDTDYLKGIAIVLMLAHHLFAFPERILPPSGFIPLISWYPLEGHFGSFGKICVPIFLFLSGYGFAVKGNQPYTYYADKVLRLFRVYWFYFILFVPIGFIFFGDVTFFQSSTPRYELKPSLILLNFFALTFSFNGEWWFVQPYLLLVITAPLFLKGSRRPVFLIAFSIVLAEIALHFSEISFDTPYISLMNFMFWQFPFACGILSGKYKGRISAALSFVEKKGGLLPAAVSGFIVWLLWHFFEVNGLVVSTPFFIYSCLSVIRAVRIRGRIFGFIGQYSFPIWLTHSFFCYYYWQKLVYFPEYSILVLVNLVVISLLSCIV
ncbi:MAG: acyltransferase family protein, partial [Spirochaetota bacterium]